MGGYQGPCGGTNGRCHCRLEGFEVRFFLSTNITMRIGGAFILATRDDQKVWGVLRLGYPTLNGCGYISARTSCASSKGWSFSERVRWQ
jgi:hypothetical protein